ncbi:uncharacterized protein LOC133529877 [Cydia pomonella]|uniref:uncharacterized protein LOC133529877 n=1 Tax=Cydia pomonella TaxID=82600 RepID=UPI002ADDB538|nr:uncharacterized protein LOC133529877 [Cydia pomonella]
MERRQLICNAEISGGDLSLHNVVSAMLLGERQWKAVASFCEIVIKKKEEAERVREDDVNAHPLRHSRDILKAGDKSRAENYRPIAILSSFAKVFESVLHSKFYTLVDPYLNDAQHGFRKGRSVNTNLLSLVNHVSDKLDKGCQVDVAYLDFRKAFDQVDNDILLEKLSAVGFDPSLLQLFASYLKDRKQFVRLGCFDSDLYPTRSGVSQGSLLGPFLFTIMVNDLSTCLVSGKLLLYADDIKVMVDIKTPSDCQDMQHNLDAIYRWSVKNRLSLNVAKCHVMSFTRARLGILSNYLIDCKSISRTHSMKDLGVLFDPGLTFHDHIRSLVAEGFKRLGFVTRNCKDFKHVGVFKVLYSALVRSKLEASSCVWSPYETTYMLMLEKVQKCFLRTLFKKMYGYYPFMYPTAYLQGALGYNALATRRLFDQLVTVLRILRGRLDCPELVGEACRLFVPDGRARFRADRLRLFAVPPARTVSRRNSPVCRALHTLNKLAAVQHSCDLFADGWTHISHQVDAGRGTSTGKAQTELAMAEDLDGFLNHWPDETPNREGNQGAFAQQ